MKLRPLYITFNGKRYNATKIAMEFKAGISIEQLAGEFNLWEPQVEEIVRRVMRRGGARR